MFIVLTIPVHDMDRGRLHELCSELRREVHVLASQQIPEYAPPEGARFGVAVYAKGSDEP